VRAREKLTSVVEPDASVKGLEPWYAKRLPAGSGTSPAPSSLFAARMYVPAGRARR
jgi:hypothetical protein